MNTKISFYLKILLVVLNVFIVGFILVSMWGPEGYYSEILEILFDYFVGFPVVIFIMVLIGLNAVYFLMNRTLKNTLYMNVMVVLLFLFAFNVALFPRLNQVSDYDPYALLVRKTGNSLEEIIRKKSDSYTDKIVEYKKIHNLLKDKTLIVPEPDHLKGDFFFTFFVEPGNVDVKKYDPVLSDEEAENLRRLPHEVIRAFRYSGVNYAYFIFSGLEESSHVYLLTYHRFLMFVPEKTAQDYIKEK